MLKNLSLLIFGFDDRMLNCDHRASMGVERLDLLFYSMMRDWKAMNVVGNGVDHFLTFYTSSISKHK